MATSPRPLPSASPKKPSQSRASRADTGKATGPATTATTRSPSAKSVGSACIAMMLLFSSGPLVILYANYRTGSAIENSFPVGLFLSSFIIATFFLLAAALVLKKPSETTTRTTRKLIRAAATELIMPAQPVNVPAVAPAQAEEAQVVQTVQVGRAS